MKILEQEYIQSQKLVNSGHFASVASKEDVVRLIAEYLCYGLISRSILLKE